MGSIDDSTPLSEAVTLRKVHLGRGQEKEQRAILEHAAKICDEWAGEHWVEFRLEGVEAHRTKAIELQTLATSIRGAWVP